MRFKRKWGTPTDMDMDTVASWAGIL